MCLIWEVLKYTSIGKSKNQSAWPLVTISGTLAVQKLSSLDGTGAYHNIPIAGVDY